MLNLIVFLWLESIFSFYTWKPYIGVTLGHVISWKDRNIVAAKHNSFVVIQIFCWKSF